MDMISKILGGSTVLLLIVSLLLFGLWQKSLAENEILRSNIATLENDKQLQDTTIKGLNELAILNAQTIQKYGDERNELIQAEEATRTEINSLRATEAFDALQKPFEIGNATDKRIRASLLRFSGNKN